LKVVASLTTHLILAAALLIISLDYCHMQQYPLVTRMGERQHGLALRQAKLFRTVQMYRDYRRTNGTAGYDNGS
jgi:hypothetical protein